MTRGAITELRRGDERETPKSFLTGMLVANVLTVNLVGFGLSALADNESLRYYNCCNSTELSLKFHHGCTSVIHHNNLDLDNGNSNSGKSNYKNVKGYLCCLREEGSDGCKKYYKCCPDFDENVQGCTAKCTNCDTIINGGNDVNDNNEQRPTGKECGFHWPCCDKKGKIGDLEKNKLKCTKYCTFCDGEWGKSKGCSRNQHSFKNNDEDEDEKKNYNHNSNYNYDRSNRDNFKQQMKKVLTQKNILNPLVIIVCIEKYQDKNKNVLTARKDYNNWIEVFDKTLKFGENIIKNDLIKN